MSKQLGEYIETNPGFAPGDVSMPTYKAASTLRKNIFKVKVYHQDTFDSDIAKNIGYDYLSTNFGDVVPQDNIGLKTFSLSEYKERTLKEIRKFVDNPETFPTILESAPW